MKSLRAVVELDRRLAWTEPGYLEHRYLTAREITGERVCVLVQAPTGPAHPRASSPYPADIPRMQPAIYENDIPLPSVARLSLVLPDVAFLSPTPALSAPLRRHFFSSIENPMEITLV